MNTSACAPAAAAPPRQTDASQASIQVLEFECQGQRFAVPLACVRRAVPSARPVPLPGASDIVLGLLNVGGETVIVLDFARRAGCGPTVISPSQQFLIVHLGSLACAFVADRINGPAVPEADAAGWPGAARAADFVDGARKLPDGLCLVIDPAKFLFDHEQAELARALEGASNERR